MKSNCVKCQKEIEVVYEGNWVCGGSCYLQMHTKEQQVEIILNNLSK